MHKKKNTIVSPNFLDNKKSTYKRITDIIDKRRIFSSLIAIFFVFTLGTGINYFRAEAEEYTPPSEQYNATANAAPVTKTIYIEKAPELYPYDENSVKIVGDHFACVKDDRVLQWQKGRNQWECVLPAKVAFGIEKESNIIISRSGAIECENDGEILYWDSGDDQWMCGTASSAVQLEQIGGVNVSQNPASGSIMTYEGGEWTNTSISDILAHETLSSISAAMATIGSLQGVTSIDAATAATLATAINGNVILQDGNAFGEEMTIGTNDNYALVLETNGVGRLQIGSDGSIMIGAYTVPSVDGGNGQVLKTDGSGSITWSDDNNVDTFLGLTDTPTTYTPGGVLYMSSGGVFGDASDFYWDDSNNRLGIGTNSPSYRLDVSGDGRFTSNLDVDGNINANNRIFVTNSISVGGAVAGPVGYIYAGDLVLGNGSTSSSITTRDADEDLTIDPNGSGDIILTGNVGVGTAYPQAELHIVGHAYQTLPKNSTFFGYQAGENDDFSAIGGNSFFGYRAGQSSDGSWNAGFGYRAMANNTNSTNAAFGYSAMGNNATGRDNAVVGYAAMANGSGNATGNAVLGSGAMAHGDNYMYNVAVGNDSLYVTNGSYNVAVGNEALRNAKTSYNTAVGSEALRNTTSTNGNGQVTQWEDIGSGYVRATDSSHGLSNGQTVIIEGNDEYEGTYVISGITANTFNFIHSWEGDTELADWRIAGQGENNTALGYQAGLGTYTTSRGSNNLFIGYRAGDNYTTGSNNIVIGYDIDVQDPVASNQLSIGNLIFGTGIDGTGSTVSSGNIGIGIASPTNNLHVRENVLGGSSGIALDATDNVWTLSSHNSMSSLGSDPGRFSINHNATDYFSIDSTGEVRIGTTGEWASSGDKVSVSGGDLSVYSDGEIIVGKLEGVASSSSYLTIDGDRISSTIEGPLAGIGHVKLIPGDTTSSITVGDIINPAARFDVDGTGRFAGTLTIGAYTLPNTDGTNGQVLKTDGSGNVAWSSDNNTSTFLGLTDTMNSYTNGSILFTSASGVTQDNANFFWNNSNNRLGVGTDSPESTVDVVGDLRVDGISVTETAGVWDPNNTNTMEAAEAMFISGDTAYVVGRDSDNLAIVDVSDPTNPRTIGNWDPNDANVIDGASSVYVVGKYAYVTGYYTDNMVIVDISDPSSPTLVGNWDPNNASIMDWPQNVHISENYAYVLGGISDNMVIVDISDPSSPTQVGNWDPGSSTMDLPTKVVLSGNYAFVAGLNSSSFVSVDISNPASPVTADRWDPGTGTLNLTGGVDVSGSYAYVSGRNTNNLAVLDISDPGDMTLVGNWVFSGSPSVFSQSGRVFAAGDYVYVAGIGSDTIAILDISDPSNPTLVENWDPGSSTLDAPTDVIVKGNYLYAPGRVSDGFAVADVGGVKTPNLFAGSLNSDVLYVNHNAFMQNNLDVSGGLHVGQRGIYSQGRLNVADSVRFASFGAGTLQTDALGNLSVSSDERLKNIDGDFSRGLNDLLNINPISYRWKDETGYDTENIYYGFSAQNIELSIPEAVGIDKKGYLTLSDRPILATAINAIKEQNVFITKNTNDLTTKAAASSVSELQILVDTQFTAVSGLLSTTREDAEEGETLRNDILIMQTEANTLSDNLSVVKTRMTAVETMHQELYDFYLAIDADKLVYVNDDGDLTVDGVATVEKLIANEVETDKLFAGSMELETSGDAPVAGQGEFLADEKEATIDTEAVTADSLVFVNPLAALKQTLAVEINCDEDSGECAGFTVSIAENVADPFKFNWFILGHGVDVEKEVVELNEEESVGEEL